MGYMAMAFSYNTLIAFSIAVTGNGWVLRENEWGQNTGKHLNYIDPNKNTRLDSAAFDHAWNEGFDKMCLNHARGLLSLPAALFDNRSLE